MKKTTYSLTPSQDTVLHVAIHMPETAPRAVVQLIHGLGESSAAYDVWASLFTMRGIAVVVADLRGQGESSGKRGVVAHYSQWLDDAEKVLGFIRQEFPGLPVILYGHSMGGNIALNLLLLRDSQQYCCSVVTSPMLEMARPISPRSKGLTRTISRIMPKFTVVAEIRPEMLSHDMEALAEVGKIRRIRPQIGLKTLHELLDSGAFAIRNAHALQTPTLLLQGGGDGLVSPEATDEFAAECSDAVTYIRFPGQRHELHNETERFSNFDTILGFISGHLGD